MKKFETEISPSSIGYLAIAKFHSTNFQYALRESKRIDAQLRERLGLPVKLVGPNPDKQTTRQERKLVWWTIFRVECEHRVDTREAIERVMDENMYLLNDVEWSDWE